MNDPVAKINSAKFRLFDLPTTKICSPKICDRKGLYWSILWLLINLIVKVPTIHYMFWLRNLLLIAFLKAYEQGVILRTTIKIHIALSEETSETKEVPLCRFKKDSDTGVFLLILRNF